MIAVIGRLRLQPGVFAKVEKPLLSLLPKSRADSGCISYEFARDVENPDVIRFAECWQDMPGFNAHNAQSHPSDFRTIAGKYLVAAPDVANYPTNDG